HFHDLADVQPLAALEGEEDPLAVLVAQRCEHLRDRLPLPRDGAHVVALHITIFLDISLRVKHDKVTAMLDDLRQSALEYHRKPIAGKVEVTATKSLITQRDLALAYTPGVAVACEAIVENPN